MHRRVKSVGAPGWLVRAVVIVGSDCVGDDRALAAGDFNQPVPMKKINGAMGGADRNRVRGGELDDGWQLVTRRSWPVAI